MTVDHESRPHGVPTWWNWAIKPRVGAGNDAGTFKAFTPWGQLYECASGNPQPSARTELDSMTSYILSKRTGTWTRVSAGARIDGAHYVEDFSNNTSIPSTALVTSTGTTTESVGGGYNYHFWPNAARVAIDPTDIGGVVTYMRARLVATTVSASLPAPCVTLSIGSDYWSSTSSTWDAYATNWDVGIGRFKRVGTNWRVFSMSTLTAEQLKLNPVPAALSSSELY